MFLDITVLSPKEIVFEGKAKSVILPGENGVFEVLVFHKFILSRLISGKITVDEQSFPIRRGIVKARQNKVTIIMEEG
jgi:F0F1-type ATP synthase epsilon subunit